MTDLLTIEKLNQIKKDATLLHSKQDVDQALARLSQQLTTDYHDKNPLFIVVMNGGLFLAGRLLGKLDFPIQVDYCHATRYRGNTIGQSIEWKVKPHFDLANRHVIIVDDILDEGWTLKAILEDCQNQGVASVRSLVLIDKLHDRKAEQGMKADYCELTAPDAYLFGCGMDYKLYWRNAEGIYMMDSKH